MKVLIDYSTFDSQRYGGISKYFSRILEQLALMAECDVRVPALVHINTYLDQVNRGARSELVKGLYLPRTPSRLYGQLKKLNVPFFKAYASLWSPDVIHQTYYDTRLPPAYKGRRIVTVFDMIHELMPEFFHPNDPTREIKKAAVDRADHILCISHSTKRDLVKLLGVPEHKITVTHLAFDPVVASNDSRAVDRPFLLYVGGRAGYKNFENFVAAVAASPTLRSEFDIVACGGGSFSGPERQLFAKLQLDPSQVRYQDATEYELNRLYRKASAFVYPSLYEGFGLPILEAMANGCPVVCSNTSSMPEVGGAAAKYFDPSNVESIANSIEDVVLGDSTRTLLATRFAEQLEKFSWQRCAMETYAAYQS